MSAAADTAAVVPKADRTVDSMDVDDPAVSVAETAAAALGASVEWVSSIAPRGLGLNSARHDRAASADMAPMAVDELTERKDARGCGAPAADSAGRARRGGLRRNPPRSRAGAESAEYQRMCEDSDWEAEEMGPEVEGMGGPRASKLAGKAGMGWMLADVTEGMQGMMKVKRRQKVGRGVGDTRRRPGYRK